MPKPKKHLLGAIATLVGMIIGAGILGIPYVVAKAGFLTGILVIVFVGASILILNLYVGEISLRTRESHQLTGYAKKYLGKTGRHLMIFAMLFGLYGALIAYTIKEGEFLSNLLAPSFGGNPLFYSILFFLLGAGIIFKGLRVMEKCEFYMVIFIIFIIILFLVLASSSINPKNLSLFNVKNIFIPYGVVLFAFLGMAAIPEIREELAHETRKLKKAIIIGSLIPLVIYILFALVVVGITGINTSEGAIIGLGNVLGYNMLVFGILLGILTMATSFIAVGLALKEMYSFDFGFNRQVSSSLTCFIAIVITIAIILINIENAFLNIIGVSGAIAGGIIGILIVLMFHRAKKLGERKPEYSIPMSKMLGFLLIAMFLAGMVYECLRVLTLII